MNHAIRWTIEKVTQRLALIEPLVYGRRAPLPLFRYQELPNPAAEPPITADVSDWPTLALNIHWGKPFTDFILRTTFAVPVEWGTDAPVALYLPLGDAGNFSHPEALAYIDGEPFAACDRHHQEILLWPEWVDGQTHTLALHGWTGLGSDWNTDTVSRLIMRECAVVQIHQATRDFVALARVALGSAKVLDENSPARAAILNALNLAFNELDTREPFGEAFYASVGMAHIELTSALRQAGPPLDVKLTATGHAHIDVAWLWTLDQTRRKAGRTFYTVLRLMEQFRGYHFTQSQPQLYEYVRQDYPALFEAIKTQVQDGHWEPIGGMWVEADCNLSGAESLARQFLLGRNFFRQHFGPGAESPVLWLPDVFGYAWALPQLIKQAGLEYFFTIKIGWNQYNRLPYDSFWWQGLDGTRVLTHFSTAPENSTAPMSTYNAPATSDSVLGAWQNFQQKDVQTEMLMAFGYGDGGGGPTREMLENLRELADFPGMPQTRQRSVHGFFKDLEDNSGADLPVWNGELYLEYHRGTYTTQSRNKRANRQSEFLLHDAEFLASLATWLHPAYVYPHETFQRAWQLVCLNQFHDIIPGSSIGPVYTESLAQYAEVAQLVRDAQGGALAAVAEKLGGALLLINPTSFERNDLAWWPSVLPPNTQLARADGTPVQTQTTENGVWLAAGPLPPYSVTPLKLQPPENDFTPANSFTASATLLENECLRVEFNAAGDITRILDKINQREVLPTGVVANQFQAFEDRPKLWDAWDIDIYYDDRMWLAEPATSIRVLESGPLRATLEIKRRILNSTYTQHISLRHNSPRLDFETQVDWRERHILLKVAFPVEVLAPAATYEIQWGNVQRPTHRNTSWDWARFETCAHKWADLSEGGYGVSLLNDCKYGHDIQGSVLRLSLLRSPTTPDPEADQGEHHFTYSLLPHAGGWDATTVREAYALNDPLISYHSALSSERLTPNLSLLVASTPNVVIETVKRAEDGRGWIARLYENQRRRGPVKLTTAFPLAAAYQANLLEETQTELTPNGHTVTLNLKPYEIVTLRLIAG